MNDVALLRPVEVGHVPASLNDRLTWLTRFGKPSVSHLGDGWHARIEMHVSAKGTTFKVATEYNHPDPAAAVDLLIARLLQTLKDLHA